VIYLLRCEQDTDLIKANWIKIGTTTRLSMRLKQITVEIGHTPTVLAVLDGGFAEEQALHRKFGFARRLGEWFEPCEDLLRLIGTEGRLWDGEDEIPGPVMVKMNVGVVAEAKMVAASRQISLAEYLSDTMRPIVRRDLEDETARRIHPAVEGEPKKLPKGRKGRKA
jgi:hypothetical protein